MATRSTPQSVWLTIADCGSTTMISPRDRCSSKRWNSGGPTSSNFSSNAGPTEPRRVNSTADAGGAHVCCAGEPLQHQADGPRRGISPELQPQGNQICATRHCPRGGGRSTGFRTYAVGFHTATGSGRLSGMGNRASAGLARFASRGGAAADPTGAPPADTEVSAAGTAARARARRGADGPQGPLGAR